MTTNKMTTKNKLRLISKILLLASVGAIIFGGFVEVTAVLRLTQLIRQGAPRSEYAQYIKQIAVGLVLIIHYFLVSKFLCLTLKKKTLLTHENAKELRVLGWETILLPIAIEIIGMIAFFNVESVANVIELEIYEIILGVFMILTGYLVDYATDRVFEINKERIIAGIIKAEYPEVYAAAEQKADKTAK